MVDEQSEVTVTARVAKLEGVVSQLAHTVETFVTNSERWRAGIASDIRQLGEKSSPNLGLLAMWAAVVITILGAFGSLCLTFTNQRISENGTRVVELDSKLQREFALSLETVKETAANLNSSSKERDEAQGKLIDTLRLSLTHDLDNHNTRLERIENWQDTMNEHELQELREIRSRALFGDRQTIPTRKEQ